MAESTLMEKIVSLAKRRGFVFPGSEIYGGLAGTFDYGPLGVLLKENVKNLWLAMFRDSRDDMYGVDAAILMNPKVWESSGHVSGFSAISRGARRIAETTNVMRVSDHDRATAQRLVPEPRSRRVDCLGHDPVRLLGPGPKGHFGSGPQARHD